MPSKAEISFARSLHQKKFRQEHKLFITEGKKAVEELLRSVYRIKKIYALADYAEKLSGQFAARVKGKISVATEKELQSISTLTTAQECVALAEIPEAKFNKESIAGSVTLMLDDISDPGNMGTIVRTAHWFGIEYVICSEKCVDTYNPKVVQAAMGSLFFVNVIQTGLEKILSSLKKSIPVYGTVLNGKNIYEEKLQSPAVILLGNESTGISEELKPYITHPITIPSGVKTGKHKPDSLNVATAAAIVCSELARR
jgi:RNA methyltransferase, TrmH family